MEQRLEDHVQHSVILNSQVTTVVIRSIPQHAAEQRGCNSSDYDYNPACIARSVLLNSEVTTVVITG